MYCSGHNNLPPLRLPREGKLIIPETFKLFPDISYVFRQSDNLLVNKEIIRQGYGHAYTKYPFDPGRMEEFRAAERSAREQKRGLWAPVDPR